MSDYFWLLVHFNVTPIYFTYKRKKKKEKKTNERTNEHVSSSFCSFIVDNLKIRRKNKCEQFKWLNINKSSDCCLSWSLKNYVSFLTLWTWFIIIIIIIVMIYYFQLVEQKPI